MPDRRSMDRSENTKREGGRRVRGHFKTSGSQSPLITVITVVYNGEQYLEETIQSVIHQTYENVEYVIIDGGSTDGTLDIIQKYDDQIDYWVSEKDKGVYDAWNKGLKVCKGEWISFLGADDIYLPDALEKYSQIFNKFSRLEYISARNFLCTADKQIFRTIGSKWEWKKFAIFMNVAHVGSLHHRSLFEKYGLYDTTFKICGDYELLLRAKSSLRAEFLDTQTCYMRIGGISNSDLNTFQETYTAKVMHGRSRWLAKKDMYMGLLKWIIRKLIQKNR